MFRSKMQREEFDRQSKESVGKFSNLKLDEGFEQADKHSETGKKLSEHMRMSAN